MKTSPFRTNFFLKLLVLPALIFSLTGCIYLIVGGVGAVGGYIVSPDTVEGITENDPLTVWDSAIEIASIMGSIVEEHEEAGTIISRINGSIVTVNVIPLNETTIKVSVKARKAFLPKIGTAQDVFVKIMSHMNE